MKNNNVILAFSGGLDTTYCAIYLKNELNLNVGARLLLITPADSLKRKNKNS